MTYDPRDTADTSLRAVIMLGCFAFAASMAGCMASNVAANNAAERKAAEMSPPFLRAPGSPMVHVEKPMTQPVSYVQKSQVESQVDTIDNPPATEYLPLPDEAIAEWSARMGLAGIGYAEARGDCKGKEGAEMDKCYAAVMHVAMNRVKAKHRGETVAEVMFAPKQFSAFNDGDPNLRKAYRATIEMKDPHFLRALRVADGVLSGRIKDPTAGSLFYHEQSISPKWNRKMQRVARIGKHVFWKG